VAFALNRMQAEEKPAGKKSKRSPLAGLFGQKRADDDAALPEVDFAAGLSRVLRTTSNSSAAKTSPVENVDPIREALASIEAALYAIDSVRDIIEQAYEVTLSANDVEDVGGRALLAESYDELRLSIDATLDKLDERAAILISKKSRQIDVKLGGKAHYSISPARLDSSPNGLNLDPPRDAFATFEEITAVMEELDSALKKADRAAAGYCRDAQFLIDRLTSEAA